MPGLRPVLLARQPQNKNDSPAGGMGFLGKTSYDQLFSVTRPSCAESSSADRSDHSGNPGFSDTELLERAPLSGWRPFRFPAPKVSLRGYLFLAVFLLATFLPFFFAFGAALAFLSAAANFFILFLIAVASLLTFASFLFACPILYWICLAVAILSPFLLL